MNKSIVSLVSCPFRSQPVLRKEARTLLAAGWKVKIIAWDRKNLYPPNDIVDGISIENILISSRYGVSGLNAIFKTIRFWWIALKKLCSLRNEFAIIHCQDLSTLIPGIIAARLLRKPIVFDSHDPYPEMLSISHSSMIVNIASHIEKFLCRRVTAILTVNHLMRKRFEKITAKPIYVVYNYPELKHFNSTRASKKNNKENPIVIGRIGSIQPGVGIEESIEAVASFKNKLSLKLLFVGKVSDSYKETFDRLLAPINVIVELVNDVPYFEVPNYYNQMDISLVLYGTKGITPYISPMKLFESMAMGVPVIATDVGEVRDIVESTNCGLVVAPGNSEAIVNALSKLVLNDASRHLMGDNGKKAAHLNFNWEVEQKKLLKMYSELKGSVATN